MRIVTWLKDSIGYIKSRLSERSTWIGISLAVTAAAALPVPWNYLSFVVGVIGSLIPDARVDRRG